MGSPVLPRFSLCTCRRHYPGGTAGCLSLTFPSNASFPCISARSASTSLVSRPAQRLLALQPAHSRSHLMTLYIGGFSRVVTFPTAPIATGRSDPCRKGLAPSQEPCLSTAHGYAFGSNAPYKLFPTRAVARTSLREITLGRRYRFGHGSGEKDR